MLLHVKESNKQILLQLQGHNLAKRALNYRLLNPIRHFSQIPGIIFSYKPFLKKKATLNNSKSISNVTAFGKILRELF